MGAAGGRASRWEATQADINEAMAKAAAIQSAAYIHALRAAGLVILRDSEGRPARVIIDYQTMIAEADGHARGLRGGFIDHQARSSRRRRS